MPAPQTRTVLVIDDDPDVCEILSLRLESFGYQMISARDGQEGIQKAKVLKPDVIFLDYAMPGQTGFDVLRQLKASGDSDLKKIPVVMLTGQEEHEKMCLEAGAVGYITKPFDLFHLKETLWKFLAVKS